MKRFMIPFLGIEYEIIDRDKMFDSLPAVVVGNHQHNMDLLMASIAFDERIVYLGKSQIGFIPFFGQMFVLGGNITVNRTNSRKARESMVKVEKALKRNNIGVVIFPEGHRNPTTTLLPFKQGAFRSAIAAQVPVVPFSVNFFSKDIDFSKKVSGKIVIKFHDPIPTEGLTSKDITELSEKCRSIIQRGMDELNKSNQG